MFVISFLLTIIFPNLLSQGTEIKEDPILCQSQKTCDDCMKVASFCRWCQKPGFKNRRCNIQGYLEKQDYISHVEVTSLQIQTDYFSITPGGMTVHFRPYDQLEKEMTVVIKKHSPVETAIVLDFSASLKTIFNNLIVKVSDIISQGLTKGIQKIGVTKFVDKTSFPIIDWRTYDVTNKRMGNPFNFEIISPLSNNATELIELLNKHSISTNMDMKEAILDAILQTAKCANMGWSTDYNVIKSIVAITDDLPKIQGEGRIVGVFRPHDSKCHAANGADPHGMEFDYPSVAQTGQALLDSKMEIIFAVSQLVKPYYTKIAESWTGVKSMVTHYNLSDIDLLSLILKTRDELNSIMELSHKVVDEVKIEIVAQCKNASNNVCYDVKIIEENKYKITFKNSELFENTRDGELYVGSLYVIPITFKRIDKCGCTDETSQQDVCNSHGINVCGGCICDKDWGGESCTCDKSLIDYEAVCKNPDTRAVCSGKGVCDECGKCSCLTADDGLPYEGEFCECERKNCGIFESELCGGDERGKCDCNTCVCKEGYFGKACENIDCNTQENNAKCMKEESTEKCSGVGVCQCGKCTCPLDKKGEFCEADADKIDCAYFEAAAFCFTDAKTKEEKEKCNSAKMNLQTELTEKYMCERIDIKNCKVFFNYELMEDKTYVIHVKPQDESTECIAQIDVGLITGLVFVGIILLGLLGIGGYFVALYLYYRAEYIRFNKEVAKQSAEQSNPLFKKKDID